MQYGSVWSPEYIDAHPLPVVSRDLLPWLLKDRREAVEGAMVKATDKEGTKIVHNGEGLDRAERELRRIQVAMKDENKPEVVEFLTGQLSAIENKVAFYRGKLYILDKVIEQTQRS